METRQETDSTALSYKWIVVAQLVAATVAGVMIALGWWLGGPNIAFAAAGGLGLVVVVATAPLCVLLTRSVTSPRVSVPEDLRVLAKAIDQLGEQAALSDDARRVLNRRRERDLLRRAIEEDITAEDWDAAMVLLKELAENFGYRADAEEFRQRIDQARYETIQRKVADAVARLDALIVQRRWDQALVDAARIGRLYPDSPRVDGLRHRVEQARQTYKTELERRFLLAAAEERIDEAMGTLKELDAYLTESEAEPFREVARGVIGKARENLGVQFKLALQDQRWNQAAAVGERIIGEFPNSRMAQEVRGMLDGIRSRMGSMHARAAG